jgi:hypothetical protein
MTSTTTTARRRRRRSDRKGDIEVSDEVTMVLERLANLFEMAGETNWTSQQIADVLRRHAIDRDLPLTNRDDEGRD